jgi:NAD(P)-dependent dehydrogenase (short-subunit alcohol dehydrogenase family)
MDILKSTVRMILVTAWSLYMFVARWIENSLYVVHDLTMLLMRIITLNQIPVFASRTYYEPAQTRFIVVTGTSSGIGNHCALQLARMGYSVIATVRKDKDMKDWSYIQESSVGLKGKIVPVWMDLADAASIYRATSEIKAIISEKNGILVGIINNAGVPGPFCPFELIDLAQDLDAMKVNWKGTLICTQQLLPLLRESKGRILVVSSVIGRVHIPWMAPYTMSKAALEAFCDSLRLETIPYGISVSILEPGFLY